ncbi:ATP-binding protein [Burkholderia ubonensis]|uniref:ATP-binding protein n=1 Tax=Burkholderia ubonensis TaxID=101571 RepID=UPI0022B75655|nr:ATP-binding protein [Burkholderia ubonensis]
MLTRDIDLIDAVLDLVDNCMDGVLRTLNSQKKSIEGESPYDGFAVRLALSPKKFSISDNCGGIPRDVAEEYAFRLGRPNPTLDKDIPTVGMYGIGMKRALFKIGRSSSVVSRNKGECFEVKIDPNWLDSDDEWLLPLNDLQGAAIPINLRKNDGTVITVENLFPSISKSFSPQHSDILERLRHTVATHYSYIIYKGLKIFVNDVEVSPRPIMLFATDTWGDNEIAPYIYRTDSDGVSVGLSVGLYAEPPDDEDIEAELEGRAEAKPMSGRREYAGWTIICNDRVVVYNDKSILTGWGEAGVPSFHSQFRSISGVVHFKTNTPLKLPVNTTKRGLDAQSELYLGVKECMREGLKIFTSFTNDWKSPSAERKKYFSAAKAVDAIELAASAKPKNMKQVRKGLQGVKFVPVLPRPSTKVIIKQIRFAKKIEEIEAVAEFLFKDSETSPSEVGERCFDLQLNRALRK